MDIEKIKEKLELREQQLKMMAEQLSEHLANSTNKDQKIQELDEKFENLENELKKKQEQLDLELNNKEILLSHLHSLESLFESPTKPRSKKGSRTKSAEDIQATTTYVDFYSGIKIGPQKHAFKRFPQFPEPEDILDEVEWQSIYIDEIDITHELEKLGVGDLIKNYK